MPLAAPLRGLLLDAVGTAIRLREPPADVYVRTARRHGLKARPEQVARSLAEQRIEPPAREGVPLSAVPERESEGWREIVRAALGPAAAEGPCFQELFDYYARAEAWAAEKGVTAALRGARARGLRVGVVSNMDARLPGLLEALGLAPELDAVILPSNTGFAKPDRRIFFAALARLETEAGATLYIGDREEDCVAAARAAGLRGLRYAPGEASRSATLSAWSELSAHLT